MSISGELQFVNTFISSEKRDRYLSFLCASKNRPKFLRELYHFRDFDPRYIVPLGTTADSADAADLRRRGAPVNCQVISVRTDLDGVVGPLTDTIRKVFALAEGTIVICIPETLAYYEGEPPKNRCILSNPGYPTQR